MASRLLPLRQLRHAQLFSPLRTLQARSLYTAKPLRDASTAAPIAAAAAVRRPYGAFRGGIFGFLLGSVLSGAATFYYIVGEYRVSNELLTEDLYALQAATQRINTYQIKLEERLSAIEKKQK